MAQIRIGHNQVVLTVTSMNFTGGALKLVATDYPDWTKVLSLKGSQPFVLVGDDGNIVATWHCDVTDTMRGARRVAKLSFCPSSLTLTQDIIFDSVTVR